MPTNLERFIPQLIQASLLRCLQRHGTSRLPEADGDKATKNAFEAYPIGFFHIDIGAVQTAGGKLSLFVAIDRTRKFAFAQLVPSATRVTASAFVKTLVAAVVYWIHTVFTDSGIQCRFAPRYADGSTGSPASTILGPTASSSA